MKDDRWTGPAGGFKPPCGGGRAIHKPPVPPPPRVGRRGYSTRLSYLAERFSEIFDRLKEACEAGDEEAAWHLYHELVRVADEGWMRSSLP